MDALSYVSYVKYVKGTNEIKWAGGAHLSSALTSSLLWVGYVQIVTNSSIQQNLRLIQTSKFNPSRSVTKNYIIVQHNEEFIYILRCLLRT
jgi:hypothetical protein